MKKLRITTEQFLKITQSLLNENIGSTKQQRFDTAIYLTYVEHGDGNTFKKVSKDVFDEHMSKRGVKETKVFNYDKNRIYRLADTKTIYYSNRNLVLGEVYEEVDDDSGEYVISHWLNVENSKGF